MRDFRNPARSKNLSMYRNNLRENRESLCLSARYRADRVSKLKDGTRTMHEHRQSYRVVVPANYLNKTGQPTVAEGMEGRVLVKGNEFQQNTNRVRGTRVGDGYRGGS